MGESPIKVRQAPRGLVEKAKQVFAQKEKEERERLERYGQIRPQMSVEAFGKRMVVVREKIYSSDKWKYFSDFLRDYVPGIFGPEWVKAEMAKPEAERHPVVQWITEGNRYMSAQPVQPDGSRKAAPSGALAAFMAFSYDMYVVADNAGLDEAVLHRLKNRGQFQGARHELFAEATCLRAGFTVEHENEKDGTRRHAEFVATHTKTGQLLSVEAKSRHRAGVLAVPGQPQPHDKLSLRFGGLINDAVAKNALYPLVVFIDTNLPLRAADRLYPKKPGSIPSGLMNSLLERVKKEHNGKDPYSMIVFTNHPHHYAAKDELDPHKHLLSVMTTDGPKVDRQALLDLHNSAYIYGNIPNEFPANH